MEERAVAAWAHGHPRSWLGMQGDPEGLANELLPSPGPRPWRRPLIMWDSRDLATFHLQPVEHGAVVHHIQHGAVGPQAGEDLEDKDGGTSGELSGPRVAPAQSQRSANRSYHHRPSHQGSDHSGADLKKLRTWGAQAGPRHLSLPAPSLGPRFQETRLSHSRF